METLKNHVLLIDQDCPMCKAYSGAFVKSGMLEAQGVENYSTTDEAYFHYIDEDKARNQIALFDKKQKKVFYGVNSLLQIITNSFPWLKFLQKNQLFIFLMKKLYNFISFNRKVVVPSKSLKKTTRECTPDYSLKYRWAFIIVLGLLSNVFLFQYLNEIEYYKSANTSYLEEFTLLVLQFVWHAVCVWVFGDKRRIVEILGHLAIVLFIGGIFLLAIKTILLVLGISHGLVYLGFLGAVALFMLIAFYKRCKLIGDGNYIVISWIIFRVAVSAWWVYDWKLLEMI